MVVRQVINVITEQVLGDVRLCYSNSDFHSSCGFLQLLSYYNASTTSKTAKTHHQRIK